MQCDILSDVPKHIQRSVNRKCILGDTDHFNVLCNFVSYVFLAEFKL